MRAVLDTLFQAVATGVFYRQLYAWMVHGRIVDYHGEFFIAPASVGADTSMAATTSTVATADGAANRWEAGCVLQPECVPCFLGTTTAASILFVGKAVAT